MNQRFPLVFCLIGLSWLAGCQHMATPAGEAMGNAGMETPEAPVRAFETDTLYSLLTGEVALHRKEYRIALGTYLIQAEKTRDPAVAERATEIAAAINAHAATAQAASLWTELEPDNGRAHFLAAMAMQQQGLLPQALKHMLASYELEGLSRFAAIAAKAEEPAFRNELASTLRSLLKDDPDNIDLLQADALVNYSNGEFKRALSSCRKVLDEMPDDLPTVALESRILLAMGRSDEALTRFIGLMETQPDNLRLHVEYARALSRVSPVDAQREFTELTRKHPQNPELLLAAALLARENADTITANDMFRRLLVLGHYRNEAHFYLGVAAADSGSTETAIDHFKAITPGNAFLESRRLMIALLLDEDRLMEVLHQLRTDQQALPDAPQYQSLRLELSLLEAEALLQHNRPQESAQVLDTVAERFGSNARVLYTRSLAYEKLGRFEESERDLRQLLTKDPNNPSVLNALGYSLANRNVQLDEALHLLQRANALQPDDPAIIDSLGWVHFRRGDTGKALKYLQTAYDTLPDAEIGAHLGEVLWVSGQQQQARTIWDSLYQQAPDHPVLRETVERLTGLPLEALADDVR